MLERCRADLLFSDDVLKGIFHYYLVLHTGLSPARCNICFYWSLHKIKTLHHLTRPGYTVKNIPLHKHPWHPELALKWRNKNISWNNYFSPPFFILQALFCYTRLDSSLVPFPTVAQLFFWRIRLAIRSSKHTSQKQFISLWFEHLIIHYQHVIVFLQKHVIVFCWRAIWVNSLKSEC